MQDITSEELCEWEAFDSLEISESMKADFRHAFLCSLIVNVVQSIFSKKGSRPKMRTPTEFLPDWTMTTKEKGSKNSFQSVEEMKEIVLALKHHTKQGPRKSKSSSGEKG